MINAADTVLLEPDLEPGARAQSRPKTCRLRNNGGNVKFSAAVSSFSRYNLIDLAIIYIFALSFTHIFKGKNRK